MKYLDTRNKSLEDSVIRVLRGLTEKVEYVEYKFRNKNDAMKAKKMLDGIQLMDFDINDDNISNGEISVDSGNEDMSKYHQDIIKQFRPKVIANETNKNDKSDDGEGLDAVQKDAVKKKFKDRKDKDIDNDGDVDDSDKFIHKKRKAITKAISKDDEKNEAFDIGNDWAKHTLKVTPGQTENDVDEMLGVMEKKRTSMREALAKMWGVNEGKNPFKKEEEKPLKKTMTGQKPTEVEVDPKTEKK